jgi:hypothetical protein
MAPTTRSRAVASGGARGGSRKSFLAAQYEYFICREHGSSTFPVPPRWRGHPQVSLHSYYGLSSLNYTVCGCFFLALLLLYPERALYKTELLEAGLYIWQGLISYQCDVVDIGIPSWSHPADRISATILTLHQVIKYLLFVRCDGEWKFATTPFFALALPIGLYCFSRSNRACTERDLPGYVRWHIAWHIAFPGTMMTFYCLQFLVPLRATHCVVSGWLL